MGLEGVRVWSVMINGEWFLVYIVVYMRDRKDWCFKNVEVLVGVLKHYTICTLSFGISESFIYCNCIGHVRFRASVELPHLQKIKNKKSWFLNFRGSSWFRTSEFS